MRFCLRYAAPLAFAALPSAMRSQAALPADSTVVVLLGTGMPRPDPDRSGPSTAVVVGSRVFVFDAGPGVERRMAAAHLPINGPTALFITHLHSDHTLGLPDLIFTSWVMGRSKPMPAYGPHGLAAMTRHLIEAWSEDEDIRTNGLEHEAPNGFAVDVHEISPGVVYDSAGVKITAIPVLHGSWKEAYGYRIDTPRRSIVISGDTRYSEALRDASRGVDVLVHEVYAASQVRPENRPGGDRWVEYMHPFHASDAEVGRLAAEARPKMVLLTHIVGSHRWDDEIVANMHAAGYAGPVVVGRDLGRY